jgi:flagellar biosynthesis protein FlhG
MVRSLRGPKTLLVASGKGGVGTSIVATLLALTAAAGDERVLLVDATESGGTLHHLFGARPARSLWMLGRSGDSRDTVIAIDETLSLIAGGTSGGAAAPRNDAERRASLAAVRPVFARFDLVVIDGGSRLDTISAIAELVDPTLLLVTSADRLALAANYALVKAMRAGRANLEISVVANRHGSAVADEACDFLTGACSHFLGRPIDVAGTIPDDPCLQAAVGAGMSVRDALDGSPAADAMRAVLAQVIPSWPNVSPAVTTPSPSYSLPSSRRWS